MGIRYLYIDDEEDETSRGVIKVLSYEPEILEVIPERAKSWAEQIQRIKNTINEYNGILLDLKLEFTEDEKNETFYYAPALANQLRTLIKMGTIPDIPIILCSTDAKVKTLLDKTSENEFDDTFDKEKLSPNDRVRFIDHAEAYQSLNKSNDLESLLTLNIDDSTILADVHQYYDRLTTSHDKAHFLLHEVINPTGILIDEDVLAFRLGVDVEKSKDVWKKFQKEILQEYKYEGIYSKSYERWWMRDIYLWWTKMFPTARPLMSLSSAERVEYLNSLKYQLEPLSKIIHHSSTQYWDKCASHRFKVNPSKKAIPIADGDGIICLPKQYTWQESEFVSHAYIVECSKEEEEEILKEIAAYKIDDFIEILAQRE